MAAAALLRARARAPGLAALGLAQADLALVGALAPLAPAPLAAPPAVLAGQQPVELARKICLHAQLDAMLGPSVLRDRHLLRHCSLRRDPLAIP